MLLPRVPFIIAEVGINHNGDVGLAKELIKMAYDCGCDAVKFQKRDIETVYTKEFLDSPRESPWGKTQRMQKMGLEFLKEDYDEIDDYCKELGIDWFASAWDLKSLNFLRKYGLKYNKVASALLTHLDFVREVAKEKKLTFISTGMSDFEDIDRVVKIFVEEECRFVLMHCVSLYPCPDECCNLELIHILKRKYAHNIGYSGHEMGILPSVLAVALGAVAIERHITLSRALYGSDQSASLEKKGLELLVRDCRDVNKMIGDGLLRKDILDAEKKVAYKLRYWRNEN